MDTAQRRAIKAYRTRLGAKGMARFEVLGRDGDQDLIRQLARRLAQNDADAAQLRAAVTKGLGSASAETGGIVAALRRSPLVGANIPITRRRDGGRKVKL